MFSFNMYLLLSGILFIFTLETCIAEFMSPPALYLYSPGDLGYLDVIVKRVGDNLTLDCEVRGEAPALFVWNYVAAGHEGQAKPMRLYEIKNNSTLTSRMVRHNLTVSDSGRYICASPPYSATKYILVQPSIANRSCARGAFACELRCVLAANVCDGRADCLRGEDEDHDLCGPRPCASADRLNCSYGGCISSAACCASAHPLCSEHDCCREHRHALHRIQNLELIPPVEDRPAPDDYGFIQSTIYTVTACALIFMIAVVLLVSAICKMHMKRAALRSYAHADSTSRAHYGMHYAQRHRFPPCYEATDLLEQAVHSPSSPHRDTQCVEEVSTPSPTNSDRRNTRLSALASVFSTRYRQVPTQCSEVEMTSVRAGPSNCCDPPPCLDDRHRLTLQLGRFHLSIPSFRRSSEPRPDTPNVAEINIDDIDFVRLNSNDTYTLNGRTIRLLGGNFENYPMLGAGNPPPYNEAMRYKLYGPPPEYLSRDRLHRVNSVDEQATSNVEMPPGYEELGDGTANGNNSNLESNVDGNNSNGRELSSNEHGNNGNDCNLNMNRHGNSGDYGNRSLSLNVDGTDCNSNVNGGDQSSPTLDEATNLAATPLSPNGNVLASNSVNGNLAGYCDNISVGNASNAASNAGISYLPGSGRCETLNSVIDNLPAIDSDVNANDEIFGNNNNLVA